MSSFKKNISVSFKDVTVNDGLLKYYEQNISKMPAGSFDLVSNGVVIYRYVLPSNVSKDNKVSKKVAYYNAHRQQYIAYYKRLCSNYSLLPVRLVGANPYTNILLKYVSEVSAITEGFLVGKNNPTSEEILDAVLKSAKIIKEQKTTFAQQHRSLDLAGSVLVPHLFEKKPVYDDNFKKVCRQFLTFGNTCLLDLDKNSEQAKQIRKLFFEAQKYYENSFTAATERNGVRRIGVLEKKLKVGAKTIKVIQSRKKINQYE